MIGSAQQSAPKQLINEVPSHVILVNDKVGANSCTKEGRVLKACTREGRFFE